MRGQTVRLEDPGNRRAPDAMPDILQRALDPCVTPGGILSGHPDNEILDLLEHAPTTRPAYVHLRAINCRCHRRIVSGVTIVAT